MELEGIVSYMAEQVKKDKKTIVLPETEDKRVLEAASIVARNGYAKIILIGNEEKIKNTCIENGISLPEENIEIIDNITDPRKEDYINLLYELRKAKGMTLEEAKKVAEDKVYFGTLMVKNEDADGLVSGAIHSTANTLRPALQIIKAREGIKNVSSFFLMESPKKELGEDGDLTGKEPKVAFLSYSTKGSAKNEAIDKLHRVMDALGEKNVDFEYDGEFQLDAALIPEVASLKAPESTVAGHANVLIFPELEAGNIGYKMAQRFGGCLALGPVTQGLKKPVNDLSRGSSVEDIVGTIIVTCMQAK